MKDANRSTKPDDQGVRRDKRAGAAGEQHREMTKRKPRGLGAGHKNIGMEKGRRGTYP